MNIAFRQAAADDVVRQFRYYLLTLDRPEVAIRFRDSVQRTIQFLRVRPQVGPRYRSNNRELRNLRSWPVIGFEAIRIYYVAEPDAIRIVRILHGKRDVKRLLKREEGK